MLIKSKLSEMKLKKLKDKNDLLDDNEINSNLKKLGNKWRIVKQNFLEKDYQFDDFKHTMTFVNAVGEIAEKYNHHPDMYVSYSEVKLIIWTHFIGGLTLNDFIMSAKFDEEYNKLPKHKNRNKIVEL